MGTDVPAEPLGSGLCRERGLLFIFLFSLEFCQRVHALAREKESPPPDGSGQGHSRPTSPCGLSGARAPGGFLSHLSSVCCAVRVLFRVSQTEGG